MNIWVWLIIALAVRLYKIGLIKCIATDGVAYIDVARDWIGGIGFHPTWPPLYPWFISLLVRIGIEPELSGQLISCLFGVGTVFMVYIVTKSIFSPQIAQISTILSVFHPYLVRYSSEVLVDSLFMFLVTASIYCGWRRLVPLTGFLTGLAYLTKPEAIFILIIISIWWRRLGGIFCTWGIFFIISLPYLYSIHEQTGGWMISQKENIVFSVALQKEGLSSEFLNVSPLEYAKENPRLFFIKIGKGLLSLLGRIPDAYHPLLFIFLIIGLVTGIREKKFLYYILTFLVPFFIGYAIFHPGRRYLVGWVPLTLFLAARGIERIKYVWIFVFVTVLIMLPKTLESIRVDGARWKEAGLWIKANSTGVPKIMCEDNRVSFYAGGEDVSLEEADYIVTDQGIKYARE